MSESRFPDLPRRMQKLPVDARGFPVPRFVQWFSGGAPAQPGVGAPDFRVADTPFMILAVRKRLCWICGEKLGKHMAFVIGPMCGINRINSEPPSHKECAVFAAQNCPFLSHPLAKRNDRGLPAHVPAPGQPIDRNPGACAVWITRHYAVENAIMGHKGWLFHLGDPEEVLWFANGRAATRVEIDASIASGLPALVAACDRDSDPADSRRLLMRQVERLAPFLPQQEEEAA